MKKNHTIELMSLDPKHILLSESHYTVNFPPQLEPSTNLEPLFSKNELIPPILVHHINATYHLIDGKSRLETARLLKKNTILCNVISEKVSTLECFKLMSCFQKDKLRASSIISCLFINHLCHHHISEDQLHTYFLPVLKLEPYQTLIQKAKKIATQLPLSIQGICHHKQFSFKQCLNLSVMSPLTLETVAEWHQSLHLSASLFYECCQTLQEVCYNKSITLTTLLSEYPPNVSSTTNKTLPLHHRIDQLKQWLKQLKYPTITSINTTIKKHIKTGNLPKTITIDWDKSCEKKETNITLHIRSMDQLNHTTQTLQSKPFYNTILSILEKL